jgi:hypothetical protein
MQHEPRIFLLKRSVTVAHIPDYRMPDAVEVHSQLMPTASVRVRLYHGILSKALLNVKTCLRRFPPVINSHPPRPELPQRPVHRSTFFKDDTVHDRKIQLPYLPTTELAIQVFMSRGVPCKDEYPAHFFVEPMNDKQLFPPTLPQHLHDRISPAQPFRDRGNVLRFVDSEEIVVFK